MNLPAPLSPPLPPPPPPPPPPPIYEKLEIKHEHCATILAGAAIPCVTAAHCTNASVMFFFKNAHITYIRVFLYSVANLFFTLSLDNLSSNQKVTGPFNLFPLSWSVLQREVGARVEVEYPSFSPPPPSLPSPPPPFAPLALVLRNCDNIHDVVCDLFDITIHPFTSWMNIRKKTVDSIMTCCGKKFSCRPFAVHKNMIVSQPTLVIDRCLCMVLLLWWNWSSALVMKAGESLPSCLFHHFVQFYGKAVRNEEKSNPQKEKDPRLDFIFIPLGSAV